MTSTITKFYGLTKPPNPLALPNLRKLSAYMADNNHIMATRSIPLNRLADGAGVSYTQTRQLVNRPGFVKVVDAADRTIGYYYDVSIGREYPDLLDATKQYAREVMEIPEGSQMGGVTPALTSSSAANVAMASQLKAEAFLKPGQFIVDPTITKRTGEFTKAEIASTLSSMGTAMLTGGRSPQQLAQAIAEITYSIQNGIMTVKD